MADSPQVALITGAAKRIGATIAKHLHTEGFNIIIHYGSAKKDADNMVQTLNTLRHGSAVALQANLCDISQVNQLAKSALTQWGSLSLLVNDASSFYPTPLGTITQDDWTSLVGSNVKGPLFLSQALAPALQATSGNIINMIDMHIDRPLMNHSVYSLAKTALASLTRSLATELAPTVRVNGVAPGAILWPERSLTDSEKQLLLSSIPLGSMGTADDIAQAVCFLNKARYITGQTLYVDGGRSLHTNAPA